MNKRISQFPQISTRDDNDWILIEEAATGAYKKIKIADFIANLSGGTGGTQPQTTKDLNWVSDGDTNGVFYWLGTNKLTTNYQNPATTGKVIVTASNIHQSHVASNVLDRSTGLYHSALITDAFFQFQLINSSLLINRYTYRGRSDFDGHHPRNWVFLASNDGNNWVNIDSVSNSTLPGLSTWFSKPIAGQTVYHNYFGILQTGRNSSSEFYLTCGEFEIYGKLKE